MLQREGRRALRRPRRGALQQLPALPLFAVTDASGTVKIAIAEPPRHLLPGCEVSEADAILQMGALDWNN